MHGEMAFNLIRYLRTRTCAANEEVGGFIYSPTALNFEQVPPSSLPDIATLDSIITFFIFVFSSMIDYFVVLVLYIQMILSKTKKGDLIFVSFKQNINNFIKKKLFVYDTNKYLLTQKKQIFTKPENNDNIISKTRPTSKDTS